MASLSLSYTHSLTHSFCLSHTHTHSLSQAIRPSHHLLFEVFPAKYCVITQRADLQNHLMQQQSQQYVP